MLSQNEIMQTIQMIDQQHLDVRTITMGISLLSCAHSDAETACGKIYDKITRYAEKLVSTGEAIEKEFGIPIVNKRISVTPIALVAAAAEAEDYVPFARTLDRAAKACGVDFIGGFSALVQKGMTDADRKLIASIPQALAETDIVCSSVNVGSTKAGINMDAVRLMGETIKAAAERTAAPMATVAKTAALPDGEAPAEEQTVLTGLLQVKMSSMDDMYFKNALLEELGEGFDVHALSTSDTGDQSAMFRKMVEKGYKLIIVELYDTSLADEYIDLAEENGVALIFTGEEPSDAQMDRKNDLYYVGFSEGNVMRELADALILGWNNNQEAFDLKRDDRLVYGVFTKESYEENGNQETLEGYLSSAGIQVELTVPAFAVDMQGAILAVPMAEYGGMSDYLMTIGGNFVCDDKQVPCRLLLSPDLRSLNFLLRKLGVSDE